MRPSVAKGAHHGRPTRAEARPGSRGEPRHVRWLSSSSSSRIEGITERLFDPDHLEVRPTYGSGDVAVTSDELVAGIRTGRAADAHATGKRRQAIRAFVEQACSGAVHDSN